ncbi:head completion/stabilization protein [Trabulsiella odontotermitis]|uniref:Head completion protein n=1 Tax=Trabulsiella odontotermitis TaxID=379893 RepID=A0A0L0H4V6_9ENTR|nr:head completion/stabilization protein [Trabulsiella odontotermitis]KNC95748.1 head completion protein [Trabulsiella odontotermitis]
MFSGLPQDYSSITVTNDGWWPDTDVADFQSQRSIPASIKTETVASALLMAIGEANAELAAYQSAQRAKGFSSAKDVTGPSAGGVNQLCAQYLKIIFARAKAELMGEITSAEREKANPGQQSEDTRDRLLAEASFAIRNIMGHPRVTVDLI